MLGLIMLLLFVVIACVNATGVVFGCITVLLMMLYCETQNICITYVWACMCVRLLDFAEQQPQLSSIGRDHKELQKKIAKLEKQREQCVRARKLSDVCTIAP